MAKQEDKGSMCYCCQHFETDFEYPMYEGEDARVSIICAKHVFRVEGLSEVGDTMEVRRALDKGVGCQVFEKLEDKC